MSICRTSTLRFSRMPVPLMALVLCTVFCVLPLGRSDATDCKRVCQCKHQCYVPCLARAHATLSCQLLSGDSKRGCKKTLRALRASCKREHRACNQRGLSACQSSSTTSTSLTSPSTTSGVAQTRMTTSTSTTGSVPSTSSSTTSTMLMPVTTTSLVSGCFKDIGDGTIYDTCTGLQWEKKNIPVGSGSDPFNLHDVDNRYTWSGCCGGTCSTLADFCQPDAASSITCLEQATGGTAGCNVCATGACIVTNGLTTVWDWLNQLNAEGFAGHHDWRLPDQQACNLCYRPHDCSSCAGAHELETIFAAPYPCGTSPCIDPIFGPTATTSVYWSGSSQLAVPANAWEGYFSKSAGTIDPGGKLYMGSVRAVR